MMAGTGLAAAAENGVMMRKVQQKAYAKINLSLDILGKREDGYHLVRMVMQTIGLSDDLTFETGDRDCPSMEVSLEADSGEISCGEDNLIIRAVRRMEKEFGIRKDLKITLKKRIPVAAGMAGGSTDAAAALRAVRDLFVPDAADAELQRIGASLGADIPYCVTGGTQLSEGIGEILTVLPDAPQCGLVICKPSFGVSTAEVYRKYDGLGPVRHPDIDAQIGAIERGIPGFDLDMNRTFPGSESGVMTEFIAEKIVDTLSGADLVFDVHASNIFLTEIPQIRINEE